MKKIFQFLTGTVKFVFGNLDYLAAFGLGAFAYASQPMLMDDIWNTIITFDLAAAWEGIKSFGMGAYDLFEQAYQWIVGLFTDAPMMEMAEEAAKS